jgi:thiol:disulfide interchange protein DsbC
MKHPLIKRSVAVLAVLHLGFAAAAHAEESEVRSRIAASLPGVEVDGIRPTPIDGLYEVTVGANVAYVSADGRYHFYGDLVDVSEGTSLTEARRSELRLAVLSGMGSDKSIVFGPESPRHTVTVFTDVNCGWCRRFHQQVPALTEKGIAVRYLFFPVIAEKSFADAEAVWCADDRNDAMTRAKAGETIEAKTCETPIGEHFALGRQLGVRSTPTIIMEDGSVRPGFIEAGELEALLDGNTPSTP